MINILKDLVSSFQHQHHRLDIGVPSSGKPSLQVLEGASVGDVKDQNGSVPAASLCYVELSG